MKCMPLAIVAKRLDTMGVNSIKSPLIACNLCRDAHPSDQCPHVMENVQILAKNCQSGPNHSFSNNYNQGGHNQGNYPWRSNNQDSFSYTQPKVAPNFPLGFQPQPSPLKQPIKNRTTTLENMFMNFINKTDAYIAKIDAHLASPNAHFSR